ncbi:MAG: ROK family protein [Roseiflexus sp.]|nr:ROK family protein [Roseiflexus sp.]MCS7289717.1 ROK family protein [Roseiflexus sp.]MDW8148745.1 ROK family protein [Roseiflexaceae bacterium]MDW8233125.1 ROK family protein [Roseiflexaceae bacterium]
MNVYLGIDLGRTKIAAAAVDVRTGERLLRLAVPTEAHEGPAAVIERMAALAGQVCAQINTPLDQIPAIGVSAPGLIDLEQGVTILLPSLPSGWRNVPLAANMTGLTSRPTVIINDARAFTLAEATFGAGRTARSVIGITLGAGIGGGIAIDGRLYLGVDGTAGEVGHMTIDPYGPRCGCGNRGCLETFASGPSITAMALRVVAQGMTTQIGALVDYDLNKITPGVIARAAEQGDTIAREILQRAGSCLGIGIANLVTIFSPERIVIGGGVSRLGEWILEPARAEVVARCHLKPLNQVQITLAQLGGDAEVIGAALWAAQRLAARG